MRILSVKNIILIKIFLSTITISLNSFAHKVNSKDRIRIPIFEDVSTFDPHKTNSLASVIIWTNIFSSLLETDHSGEIKPNLVTHYTESLDKLKYTFYLKKNLKWSDGRDLTSKDVVFSFLRAMDGSTNNPMLGELLFIKNAKEFHANQVKKELVGIKQIDDYTVEIELNTPSPYFIQRFASFVYSILPSHTIEKHGKDWTRLENIVTYGPYLLKQHVIDSKIILEKNFSFWDSSNVHIPQVEYLVLKNPQYQDYLFKKNKIDFLSNIPENKVEKFIKDPKANISDIFSVSNLSFNLNKKHLQNPSLRMALSCALHLKKPLILSKYLHGLGKIATNIVPPGLPDYPYQEFLSQCTLEDTKMNFENAKRELKGELPPLNIVFISHPALIDFFQIIQDIWKETLGVKSILTPLSWNSMISTLSEGKHDINIMTPGASLFDPIDFLDWYISDEPRNFLGLKNEEYDMLFQQAMNEFDKGKRFQLLSKLETILLKNYYLIPLFTGQNLFFVNKNLKMLKNHGNITTPYTNNKGHLSFNWSDWILTHD